MGIGEILLMTIVVVMFLVACYRGAKTGKGSSSFVDHFGDQKAKEDIARLRQIAEYDRFAVKDHSSLKKDK